MSDSAESNECVSFSGGVLPFNELDQQAVSIIDLQGFEAGEEYRDTSNFRRFLDECKNLGEPCHCTKEFWIENGRISADEFRRQLINYRRRLDEVKNRIISFVNDASSGVSEEDKNALTSTWKGITLADAQGWENYLISAYPTHNVERLAS